MAAQRGGVNFGVLAAASVTMGTVVGEERGRCEGKKGDVA